jgi:DNA end-binding protein Ku
MAARPTWKGVLKISLVTIPIKVFPATDASETISFNQLHETCQTKITSRRWCVACAKEVPSTEIVKGHEFEKGKYVILSEDEIATVKPESTKVIDLVQFDAASALDSLAVDRSYYLAPNGTEGDAYAYGVLRSALTGKVGVGKLAVYGREYLVAVRPSGRGLLLQTLHHAGEIRALEDLDDLAVVPAKVKPVDVTLARQVIATLARPLQLTDFTDDYQAGLRAVIDAKIEGKEIVEPKAIEAPPLVGLKDALKRSLHLVPKSPKKPAKVAAPVERKRKRA